MSQQPSIIKLSDEVSNLSLTVAKIDTVVDRFDIAIDKLVEVSATVSRLLAVHETKITAQEALTKNTSDLVEKRRVETEDKVQQLHARISSGEKALAEKIDQQYDDIIEELKEMRTESTEQHKSLSTRITAMEKWQWIIVGGAIVIGTLLSKINLTTLFG